MGYREALEAAGADIIEFEEFGDYQGTWWAKLSNGKFVSGSYGSCSHCDAFEAEFDWDAHEEKDYQQRLANFGRTYLENTLTKEEALKAASSNLDWDLEAQAVIDWILK